MMLWDIIRDFFVRYIFGGIDSLGSLFTTQFGMTYVRYIDGTSSGVDYATGTSQDIYFLLPDVYNDSLGIFGDVYYNLGDYLSTTATIIVMVLLCILLVKLAIWIFKLGANLIRLR